MIPTKQSKTLFFTLITLVYISAWVLQTRLSMNWDVSQLLYVTERMLNGGKYGIDFITPNPPMILYLYTPPLLFSKLLSISIITTMRLYFFVLSCISLLLCYSFIKNIYFTNDFKLGYILMVGLAVIFLIVPADNFGQRDHLLVLFTMPYLLAASYQLLGHRIHSYHAIFIGLFASAGLLLKPHFLILLFLVEAYYAYYKKSILSPIRIETITIISTTVFYLITTAIFYPEFFNIIIPFMTKYYYSSNSTSLIYLLLDTTTILSLLSVLIYLYLQIKQPNNIVLTVFMIGLIAFILIFIYQASLLNYHKTPELSLTILLLLASYYLLSKRINNLFMLTAWPLFLPLIFIVYEDYKHGYNYKQNFLNEIISFAKRVSTPHKTLYVLAQSGHIGTPLIHYTDISYVQRIDGMWVASDLIKKSIIEGDESARNYIKNNVDNMFFLNLIADDLIKNKPDLVFIDVSEYNFSVNGHLVHFDYLDYFLENHKFKTIWNQYRCLTKIRTSFYSTTLDVYIRLPNSIEREKITC